HQLNAYKHWAPRAQVIGIEGPAAEARNRRGQAYATPTAYATGAEMLERERLDAVDIASPRETHVAMCELAAARGLEILCQKPLAPNLREAQTLLRNLPAGTRLMVHENWRFRPHYRLISHWLNEGRVGKVRQAAMTILTSGLLPDAQGRLPAVE